ILAKVLSRRMPALHTRMSTRPHFAHASATIASTAAKSVTEAALAMASPPAASISATTFCAGVAAPPVPSSAPPKSLTTTLAPRAASARACARPNPPPAPVTIATRLSKRIAMTDLREDFAEQFLHRFPGMLVGLGVVFRRRVGLAVIRGVGEGVNRVAVMDQFPVAAAVLHFLDEAVDFGRRYQRIVGAVAHQDLALDVLGVGRSRARETAMEADDAAHIGAAARQFEHGAAAEAVADRAGSAGIHLGPLVHRLQRGVDAAAQFGAVVEQRHEEPHALGEIFRNLAAAIHIDGAGEIAEIRQHMGAALGVVGEAENVMAHQHAGPLARLLLVISDVGVHGERARTVFDGFGLHGFLIPLYSARLPASAPTPDNQSIIYRRGGWRSSFS